MVYAPQNNMGGLYPYSTPMFNSQRFNYSEPNYNQQYNVNSQQINACFVGGIQEAQAQPVGLNMTNVSIDNTNKKIYLKSMNNDGVSTLQTYIIQPEEKEDDKKAETKDTTSEKLESVYDRVNNLEGKFEPVYSRMDNLEEKLQNISDLIDKGFREMKKIGDKK